jgi:NADH:ubiquinone oxidoreductase subunit 2 (subunit N)
MCASLDAEVLVEQGAVEALDDAVIRYVICGAFSSCCFWFGTALW